MVCQQLIAGRKVQYSRSDFPCQSGTSLNKLKHVPRQFAAGPLGTSRLPGEDRLSTLPFSVSPAERNPSRPLPRLNTNAEYSTLGPKSGLAWKFRCRPPGWDAKGSDKSSKAITMTIEDSTELAGTQRSLTVQIRSRRTCTAKRRQGTQSKTRRWETSG